MRGLGWKGFEVKVLCTEMDRQLVWTMRVAGNTGQGNALETATSSHPFAKAAPEHATRCRSLPSSCPVLMKQKAALYPGIKH